MITIEFKFYAERLGLIQTLLAKDMSKGVKEIGLFDKGDNLTTAIWVRVVATPEQLQTPMGLYREFMLEVIKFDTGAYFEIARVTMDKPLSFAAVERMVPLTARFDFYRAMAQSASGSANADLFDDMTLEVRKNAGNHSSTFEAELTVWQKGFQHILRPVGAYDGFLKYYNNPQNMEEGVVNRARFASNAGRNILTLSTPLSPHNFWPLITWKTPSDVRDATWIDARRLKIIFSDSNGTLKRDRTFQGFDIFYTQRLSAMNGLRVLIEGGEQLISCVIMDGLWYITLNIKPEELRAPTGLYAEFLNAQDTEIRENTPAA